jgi:hypothetical protein
LFIIVPTISRLYVPKTLFCPHVPELVLAEIQRNPFSLKVETTASYIYMNGCHTSLNSKFDDYVHAPVFWDICIDPCHPSPCGAKKAPTKQLLMQYFEEDVTIIYIIMLNSSDSKQEAFQVWFSKKTSYPLDHAPSHQVITRDHQNIPCFHMFSASSGGDLAAVLQLWELVAGR